MGSDGGAVAGSDAAEARGVFLVLEGGEGVGKSTQTEALARWLGAAGREVVLTREPGATDLGREIRRLLLETGTPSPRTEALLYAADRAEHVERVILPALARGAVVLCDRYVDSSVAYQAGGRGLAVEDVVRLSDWATDGLAPDLVILLDADPDVGLARVAARGDADRMERESREFHRRVRALFLARAAAAEWEYAVVAADREADRVTRDVREEVASRLPGLAAPVTGR